MNPIRILTTDEMISYLNEMIDLYDEVIKNGHTTFKNGEKYYDAAGICSNLLKCVYQKHYISISPESYYSAIKKWATHNSVNNLSFWLDGNDEYLYSYPHRMSNPKRLEAMVFIRDELLKGD